MFSSDDPNSDGDVQKKISLLNNPQAIVGELFRHLADPSSTGPLLGDDRSEFSSDGTARSKSGLVLVASLVSKVPNLGGKFASNLVRRFFLDWSYLHHPSMKFFHVSSRTISIVNF